MPLHGIGVHVVEFLLLLFVAVNPKGIEAPLPDSKGGLIMDRRREPQLGEHPCAPGVVCVLTKDSENASG